MDCDGNYLIFYKGDTWTIPVAKTNDDGTPYDFTGYTPVGKLHVGNQVYLARSVVDSAALQAGFLQFVVDASTTNLVPADVPFQRFYGTRFQALVEVNDIVETIAVINIRVKAA